MSGSAAPIWAFLGSILGGAIGAYLNNHLGRHRETMAVLRQKAELIIADLGELSDLYAARYVAVQSAVKFGNLNEFLKGHGAESATVSRINQIHYRIEALVTIYFRQAIDTYYKFKEFCRESDQNIVEFVDLAEEGVRRDATIWKDSPVHGNLNLFKGKEVLVQTIAYELKLYEDSTVLDSAKQIAGRAWKGGCSAMSHAKVRLLGRRGATDNPVAGRGGPNQ